MSNENLNQWHTIPIESIFIQAHTPDGPIELTIEMLAALLEPFIMERFRLSLKQDMPNLPPIDPNNLHYPSPE